MLLVRKYPMCILLDVCLLQFGVSVFACMCALSSEVMRQDNQGNSLCKPHAVSQLRLEGRDVADAKLSCTRDHADK